MSLRTVAQVSGGVGIQRVVVYLPRRPQWIGKGSGNYPDNTTIGSDGPHRTKPIAACNDVSTVVLGDDLWSVDRPSGKLSRHSSFCTLQLAEHRFVGRRTLRLCGSEQPSRPEGTSVPAGLSGAPPGTPMQDSTASHAPRRTAMHNRARATGRVGRRCRTLTSEWREPTDDACSADRHCARPRVPYRRVGPGSDGASW